MHDFRSWYVQFFVFITLTIPNMPHLESGKKDLEAIQGSDAISEKLAALTGSTESLAITHKGAALAIVAEHSFFVKQENQQVSFKQSIETALDTYLDSASFAATMSAIEAMDFAVLGKKMFPVKSFLAPGRIVVDAAREKAEAQSHLHESVVKIVLKNRITHIPEEEILM
ncbi:hypothetical protein DXG01_009613 [Tephrocybe rancida]|nr:hypothetical protein DXG01_009613 [Tephrocybe rancida]